MKRQAWMAWGLLVLLSVLAMACTKSDVEVKETFVVPQVDNQLLIHGEVCTAEQDNVAFPVKIMFIVDSSGSMQQTDEGDNRVEAVRQVVRSYANQPNVFFSIIKYNGRITDLTEATGFTDQLTGNEPEVFGTEGLLEADSMTDYQGALAKAYTVLLEDMMATVSDDEGGGLAQLARTKYVVIFFSDGTPDPVCYGCVTEPPNHPRYLPECPDRHDAYGPPCCNDDLHVVCTLMDELVLDMTAATDDMFTALEGGTDYNHNYQIFQLVDELMELKDAFHVGDLRLHTAFLYCRDQFGNPTSALCAAAEEAYNLDPDRGRALLREMASRGNGTFRDFTSGQAINFLNFDYTSIQASYTAKNLLVTNMNALPGSMAFLPDSDADGIDDDAELRNGTEPQLADTDGDGYGDFVEEMFRKAGFDPADGSKPGFGCEAGTDFSDDADGDGLNFCEELLFGTLDDMVDTDADGFPDLYEIRFGTDPLRDDTTEDLDSDGRRNSDELLFHSHPARSDPDLFADHRYWYEMRPIEGTEGRNCYEFDIRYVSLITTLDRDGPGSRGYNDIMIWFNQASSDNPLDAGLWQVACVQAQYIAPDYKIPFEGEISLTVDDFHLPLDVGPRFENLECVTASE